jgi:basic amino acid/polyamine antiporter, APA family
VSGEASLVRALGTVALAAGIINITVGGGIFRLPADVGGSLGAAAPLAYLVCAVAMGLIVLCFADAGSRVALTGGPYAYVDVAFGPFVAFMAGVLLWMLGTFALAAVTTFFADNVAVLIPIFSGAVGRALLLVGVFALFAFVNARGVKHGARLNTVSTAAKLVPLLLLAVVGLFAIEPSNLEWTRTPTSGEVARTSILLIFAFSGVETALVPSGEVKDPSRTVPRAVLLAMLGITVLYIVLQIVAQGVLGEQLPGQQTPLAAAAGVALGGWARSLLLVGASLSMFGYIGGMTLAVPRALYAFARDGFLPRPLARVHPIYRTPHLAIYAQSAIACALAISSTFERLAILANLATLLLYAACCLASWRLRQLDVRQSGTPFRVPLAPVLPWIACAVIAWMLTSIRPNEWLAVGIVLAIASVIYLATRSSRAAAVAVD